MTVARPHGTLAVFSLCRRIDSKSSHRRENIHHRVVGQESKHSFPPKCHCLDVLVFNKSPDREVEVSQEWHLSHRFVAQSDYRQQLL